MIRFSRMNLPRLLLDRLLRKISPAYRRKRAEVDRATFRWLLDHPEEPCIIEDKYIPDGYGEQISWEEADRHYSARARAEIERMLASADKPEKKP